MNGTSTFEMLCLRPFCNAVQKVIALLILACTSGVLAAQAPADNSSQQQRAWAAMQGSLAAQQTALDSFRDIREPGSLKQQGESIRRQTDAIEGLADLNSPGSKAENTPAQTEHAAAKSFFSLPWPSSVPLAVPNIQMVDDTCEPMRSDEVEKLIQAAAKKHGIEPQLLKSVMRQESGFKPCAVSTAGAMGLMQIMPETAEMLSLDDPFDPVKNTDAGAQFLKNMLDRYQGNVSMALGAYNAGPGRVDKAGGVPPISETIQYVTNVLRNLSLLY